MITQNGMKLKDKLNVRLLRDYFTWINGTNPILWVKQQEIGSPIAIFFYGEVLLWVEDIQITVHAEKEESTWQ